VGELRAVNPILNASGGLRYHARGFRYQASLWRPFRWHLSEWLYRWTPPERRLVLVGPSAGSCIEPLLLERFDEILCLEPDPVARFLFSRKVARAALERRPKLRFESRDLLIADPSRFAELLRAEGDVAVLFSNVLGQLRVLVEGGDVPARLAEIRAAILPALGERSWASFHDRVSGEHEPMLEEMVIADGRLSDAEILSNFFPTLGADAIGESSRSELFDHMTRGMFPEDAPHAYLTWELMPRVFHLIESTFHARAGR
jgi:hypothetical protein